ncbi:hypothetical protein D8674_007786 [Pyrus ussuriensis x Pyrus communis]|uniref:Pentatricopeptide repeat-containing protein n=1 Tax=Pyrus ussuriensis x Pyrus communis TaxID=2448454 RepID=A0A5N5HTT3_9ROSA|nr:hypothetical protein D8674_007786 [Pyrus ussuriensis x Pyrus communis]
MLVDAYCKDGLMEKQMWIFPTLWHYCRITGLCRQGNVEIAMKIVKVLKVDLINQ